MFRAGCQPARPLSICSPGSLPACLFDRRPTCLLLLAYLPATAYYCLLLPCLHTYFREGVAAWLIHTWVRKQTCSSGVCYCQHMGKETNMQ